MPGTFGLVAARSWRPSWPVMRSWWPLWLTWGCSDLHDPPWLACGLVDGSVNSSHVDWPEQWLLPSLRLSAQSRNDSTFSGMCKLCYMVSDFYYTFPIPLFLPLFWCATCFFCHPSCNLTWLASLGIKAKVSLWLTMVQRHGVPDEDLQLEIKEPRNFN